MDSIRLFPASISSSTDFNTNGLGCFGDAISCVVTEERNGTYELEMKYPKNGRLVKEIQNRRIVLAKPNPYTQPQPFRIYNVEKSMKGNLVVKAEHISYDLLGYPVRPFTATDVAPSFSAMLENSVIPCPFTFTSTKSYAKEMKVERPISIRNLLYGESGSFLDVFNGGEYEFDRYSVTLRENRGSDLGVTIRYGKNLTSYSESDDTSSVYTGVYPYYYSDDIGLIESNPRIVEVSGEYDFERILVLDFTQEYTEVAPTPSQLYERTVSYIQKNQIGTPKVNLEINFVQLSLSNEYRNYALLEQVHLCDTVHVFYPQYNVTATAKVMKTEYDAIGDKYISLELGSEKSSIAKTLAEEIKTLDSNARNYAESASDNATKRITGGLGGYVVMRSSTGGPYPDEILVMNAPTIEEATNIWRWNQNGLGFSDSGYAGPYRTAMTNDGKFVADFIASGEITSELILVSSIVSKSGNMTLSDSGLRIKNLESNTESIIDDEHFAILYNDEVVLTVARDETILETLRIVKNCRVGDVVITTVEGGADISVDAIEEGDLLTS